MSEQEEKAVTPVSDDILSALLMGSTWGERGKVGDRTWEDMNEEERSFAREWVMGMLFSREAVEMVGAYMDMKGKPAPATPVESYVSFINGEGVEERISLTEMEERAIDDWWKDEKGEI